MGDMVFPGGLRPDGLPAALSAPDRLAAVRATGLLDTGPEDPFDDLARLAAAMTGCGRVFITVVDERRSFWKCIRVEAEEARACSAHRKPPSRRTASGSWQHPQSASTPGRPGCRPGPSSGRCTWTSGSPW